MIIYHSTVMWHEDGETQNLWDSSKARLQRRLNKLKREGGDPLDIMAIKVDKLTKAELIRMLEIWTNH